jgi:hypothetical protein
MKKMIKLIGFGVLTWLVPFVIGFFFYTPDGKLAIDKFLFKSIMIVVSSINGAFLLVIYFKKIDESYRKVGLFVGIVWLAINWGLDLLVLLPMAKMSLPVYFAEIGLRYLVIPVISIGMGCVADQVYAKSKEN